MNRLVSAIIPVFERPGLTERAIASVLAQQLPPHFDLELIVVDDGSSRGTRDRLSRATDRDDRARLLTLSHRGMPGAVRNRGVEVAQGDVLAFLDSDDTWQPGKLLNQLPLHGDRGSVQISHTRERWIRNGHTVSQSSQRHRRSGNLFFDSLKKCIIGPSTVVIDRSLYESLGGFREDLEIAEDYELWLRVTSREPVGYIEMPLTTKYAGHGDQLSERYPGIEQFRIAALLPLVEHEWFLGSVVTAHVGTEAQYHAEIELARKCRVYAAGARRRGRIAEADRYESIARRWASL